MVYDRNRNPLWRWLRRQPSAVFYRKCLLAIVLIGVVYAMIAYIFRGMIAGTGPLWQWFLLILVVGEWTQIRIRDTPRGRKRLDDFYGKIVQYL